MPRTYNYVPLTPADTADMAAFQAAVVRATPGNVAFGGLQLALPFGARGSIAKRATAKTYGARWDGVRWTLPNVAAAPGAGNDSALKWLFTEGFASHIITYVYTPWVWDGQRTQDLMLDVPFTDRHRARSAGARWHAGRRAWYLPAAALSQALVDWANGNGWAHGYWNTKTGAVEVPPVPAPAPAPHSPAAVMAQDTGPRAKHDIAVLYGLAATAASGVPQPSRADAYAAALRTGGTSVYWLTAPCARSGGTCVICWAPVPAAHMPGLMPVPASATVPETVYCMLVRHGLSPSSDLRDTCRTASGLSEWARVATAHFLLTAEAAATAYEGLARDHGFARPAGHAV